MKDNEEINIQTWNFQQEMSKTLAEKYDAFVAPTFENFFTTDELQDIAYNAATVCTWDFNVALGDTIREKYQSLYVKVSEVTNVLVRKGAKGYFWIVTSPTVASIFETATYGFWPTSEDTGYSVGGINPIGLPMVQYLGRLDRKWRLYSDTTMPEEQIVIGCNDTLEDYSHYARMSIANLII